MAHEIEADEGELTPPILYKYTPVGTWVNAFFSGISLRFSTRTSFNDPFDCRPSFQVETSEFASKVINDGLKGRGMSPAKRLLAVKRALRMSSDQFDTRETEKHLDQIGILCLTPNWSNALMWSHYADHHRGICIGFRSDSDVFTTALKVVYRNEAPIVAVPTKFERDTYDKVFLTKAKCWEYEQEWRIIKTAMTDDEIDEQYREFCCFVEPALARAVAEQRGAGIYKFDNSSIESVSLGMRISAHDEILVREAIDRAGLDVQVYRISPPKRSYNLARTLLSQAQRASA